MSHTLQAAMVTHLASEGSTLALCIKATRDDGSVFAWTEHDSSLTIDLDGMGYADGDGSQVYLPAPGFVREAFEQQSNLRVANSDIVGVLDAAGLTRSDVMAGRWDEAEVKVFFANWADTSSTMGIIPVHIAYVDQVTISEATFRATFRDISEKLNSTTWLSIYGPRCRNSLGSVAPEIWRCGVQLSPPVWAAATAVTARPRRDARAPAVGVNTVKPSTFNGFDFEAGNDGTTHASTEPTWPTALGGTVADNGITWTAIHARTLEAVVGTATNRRQFTLTTTTGVPNDFYSGVITFGVGAANDGLSMEVKSFYNGNLDSPAGAVAVELVLPMPFDVAALDDVSLTAFCSKRGDNDASGCFARFDNIYNFSGAHLAPTDREWFSIR